MTGRQLPLDDCFTRRKSIIKKENNEKQHCFQTQHVIWQLSATKHDCSIKGRIKRKSRATLFHDSFIIVTEHSRVQTAPLSQQKSSSKTDFYAATATVRTCQKCFSIFGSLKSLLVDDPLKRYTPCFQKEILMSWFCTK